MSLSAMAVTKAKGKDRAYKLADANGLFLYVTPEGRRYWRMNYRFDGKQRTLSFGVFPEVSLADARGKRDTARKALAEGNDPGIVKKRAAIQAKMDASNTFKIVAEEWLDKAKREGRAEVTLGKLSWLLGLAYPKIGDLKVNDITAPELLAVLRAVEKRGHYETARRLRSTCGQVFRYAIAIGLAKRDPSSDLRGALIVPKVTHRAAIIDPKTVGVLLRAIDSYSGYAVTHAALRLAPHVFARPGELRQAEWREFDFEKALWTIPAEKTKMRNAHRVPLSRQALAIIHEIRALTGNFKYVFPAQGKRDRPMCENTINY
ncbi:MAG: integrase arm-type DNA-binding domain-containing protein, partial [Alphaproteobacteria bacterium]|nr:integrase arm-type DNA-binding domain-containing protein [Alphaproteobacteria bacterium]